MCKELKLGSQYDAMPCVSLHYVSALYCKDDALLLTSSDTTYRKIQSDFILRQLHCV